MTRQTAAALLVTPRRRSARLAVSSGATTAVPTLKPTEKIARGGTSERMVAFLRGVNMFGGVHSMSVIRDALTADGLTNVATFLISGNVVFDVPRRSNATPARLERRIERVLRATFDQDIPVYVRSMREMQGVLTKLQPAPTTSFYFGMLKRELTAEQRTAIAEAAPETDAVQFLGAQFAVHATNPKRSVIYKSSLEKTLGERLTVRKVNTWTRLVRKFGGASAAR